MSYVADGVSISISIITIMVKPSFLQLLLSTPSQSMSTVIINLQLVFASSRTFLWWFSEGFAKHPLITIQICLVFVSVCSVGFVWFKSETRTDKLFVL